MDPDATLNELRELMTEVEFVWEAEVHEIVEKFQALDAWLSSGGFLPTSWDLSVKRPEPVEPARRDAIADHEEIWCDRCDRDNEHNFVDSKCLCCGKVKS